MNQQGQHTWRQAKKIIPGGTGLLSKRAEMFLPEQWPVYYKTAKGIQIESLDKQSFLDFSIMGMGSCAVGYAVNEIDNAVIKAIQQGVNCTLNAPEEFECAQLLCDIHPGMAMARFTRSGGEACAVAVRIARAYAKRDKIAFCGYHGWHDWYLAANLADQTNLDGQLLPGLDPSGVPRGLKDSAYPFHYGDKKSFDQMIRDYGENIGVIIMEVARYSEPDIDFLNHVQQVSHKNNIVLIYDEISSGFRLALGGMYQNYGLKPDMVVLGKALGNGYPIAAVLGKNAVMDAAQESFISSTLWTERSGFVAALATMDFMKKHHVIDHNIEMGEYIKDKMREVINEVGLNIDMIGLASVPIFAIKEKNPLVVKTYFTQEMLKQGFLASTVIYLSYCHKKHYIDKYVKAVKNVFINIRKHLDQDDLQAQLEGPVCHSGFTRLN